jgi:hypothetical protein
VTIDQFRQHPSLPTQWVKEMETNPVLRIVLEVMEDSHPARFAITGDKDDDISPTRASIELGMTRGYSKFGDTLRLLAQRKLKREDPGEPTYTKEEPLNQPQNA